MPTYAIAGAGFSGAVLARKLVESSDCRVVLFEERPHIAGNCHTDRDPESGVMVHKYGPHIFHTDRADVWEYVNRFGKFGPFVNRVKASTARGIFSLPINLHTINQFYGKKFNPTEARAFLDTVRDASIVEARNFEEQALKGIGPDLYQAFMYGYTKKQWGCEPRELPASILQRLPVRFNYNDNYYNSTYQGIPIDGYTSIVEGILQHPQIEVKLGIRLDERATDDFDQVFWTGSIDAYYGYRFGRLSYRTVYFERQIADGDYQGNAVINYPEMFVPYTRIHEHKHFAPWETHAKTDVFTEFSKETEGADTPYYPKRLAADKLTLEKYLELASNDQRVTFLGRLGTYRYLDMDVVIGEALAAAETFLHRRCGA